MKKVIQFGEQVDGYSIPVLNEREIRASAGILFVVIYTSLLLILLDNNFILAKYSITLFLSDFLVRVFINPRFSPTLILGRLIVRKQVPEYVGAKQKRFAWIIGVGLSATMYFFMIFLNTYSPITGIICLMCLIFLFFESAFGICLACKVYRLVYKENAQYCPGEVCDAKSKQDIQKISPAQLLILAGFITCIIGMSCFLNTYQSKTPHNLFGKQSTAQVR